MGWGQLEKALKSGWLWTLQLVDQIREYLVLRRQMLLDLDRFVQDRFGIVVGVGRALVRRGALDLLADDDDRQQHELKECLRDPGDQRRLAAVDRVGEAEQRQQ